MRIYHRCRRGFTLVELLVVIGIVSVLVGLLLVTMMKVNEAASRASCTNNMRQLAIGLHLFHDTYGSFPTSGGGSGKTEEELTSDTRRGWDLMGTNPESVGLARGSSIPYTRVRFGLPDPNQPPEKQLGSWSYTVLPYIEQSAAFWNITYSARIPVYTCPSRRSADPQACPTNDPVLNGIVYYYGTDNPYSKTDYNVNGLIMQCFGHPTTSIDQITHGASQVILLGEKSLDSRTYTTGGWYWDDPAFMGCNARTGTSIYPDKPGVPFANNWGAAHPSSANFAFADGSVRSLKYGLSARIVEEVLTPWDDAKGVKLWYASLPVPAGQ